MKKHYHTSVSLAFWGLLSACGLHQVYGIEVFSDDFANSPSALTGSAIGRSPVQPIHNAQSGRWSFQGDLSGPSSNHLTSAAITMPETGGLRISFEHRFNLEPRWDGVLLQFSVNGGDFVTVPPEAFTQNGYTYAGLIGVHELLGESAFSKESPGYASGQFITSVADFGAAAAGDTIQVRFVGAWDLDRGAIAAPPSPNWEIDSLTITTREDGDGDGMPDDYEQRVGHDETIDDAEADGDGDGLSSVEEFVLGTDPGDADSDDDGLIDGIESNTGIYSSSSDMGTNPLVADTDGDGLLDSVETNTGTYAGADDTGSDPFNADSDADGYFSDGLEVEDGSDPNDSADNPALLELFTFDDGNEGFTDLGNTGDALAFHSGARGTWAFRGDTTGPSANYLTSPEIPMPATGGLRIIFNHRYSTEHAWGELAHDGVAVQVSVNNGAYRDVTRDAFSEGGLQQVRTHRRSRASRQGWLRCRIPGLLRGQIHSRRCRDRRSPRR